MKLVLDAWAILAYLQADAFAASAAKELDATLLTGDPELCRLLRIISIEPLIRHE